MCYLTVPHIVRYRTVKLGLLVLGNEAETFGIGQQPHFLDDAMKQQVLCRGQVVWGSHWIIPPSSTSCSDVPSSLLVYASLWAEAIGVVVVGGLAMAATISIVGSMGSVPEGS